MRLSSPEQTFVDVASLVPLVDLVVVGDHLVRHGLVTLDRRRDLCAASNQPGATAARATVSSVRERVDSPMETRLRMLIVLAALPEPRVNRASTRPRATPSSASIGRCSRGGCPAYRSVPPRDGGGTSPAGPDPDQVDMSSIRHPSPVCSIVTVTWSS